MQEFYSLIVTLAALVVVACVTAACSEQPRQQLSPEELELTEALMFVLEDVESNGISKYKDSPWKRKVAGRDVEYISISRNGITSSDDDWNAKTRDSKFIQYTEKISSLDKCVFRKSSIRAFSKGDSKEDFTTLVEDGNLATLHLMNAYRFEVTWEYPTAEAIVEGPGVVCQNDECGNIWGKLNYPEDTVSSSKTPVSVDRRRKALELIKKSCPGKPY